MTKYLTGQRFEVKVDLDKPRLLRIDFNALCRAEGPSGLSFLDWSGELTGVRLKAIVWASIVYEPDEERLTYEEVGDALNSTALVVVAAITEAVTLAMPDPEDMESVPGNPQKAAPAKG